MPRRIAVRPRRAARAAPHGRRRVAGAPLLQARRVVDRQSGELRELLAGWGDRRGGPPRGARGSIAITSDPERVESTFAGLAYPASKTAVNMLTTRYAKAFPDIRVNAVDPGYTATDFNRNSGTQTVAEGTDAIVAMAAIGPDGPTGTFVDRQGAVPW